MDLTSIVSWKDWYGGWLRRILVSEWFGEMEWEDALRGDGKTGRNGRSWEDVEDKNLVVVPVSARRRYISAAIGYTRSTRGFDHDWAARELLLVNTVCASYTTRLKIDSPSGLDDN